VVEVARQTGASCVYVDSDPQYRLPYMLANRYYLNDLLPSFDGIVLLTCGPRAAHEYRALTPAPVLSVSAALGALSLLEAADRDRRHAPAGSPGNGSLLARGLSGGTVLNLHLALTNAFGQAVRWGLLVTNPAAGAQPPRPRRPELPAVDATLARRILRATRGTAHELPAAVAIATGMRRGEILALKWSDRSRSTCTASGPSSWRRPGPGRPQSGAGPHPRSARRTGLRWEPPAGRRRSWGSSRGRT
jgi:integrase